MANPEWTEPSNWPSEAKRQADYDRELIRRYQTGEPLTKLDTKSARRLLRWQVSS